MQKEFGSNTSVEEFLEGINPFGNITTGTLKEVFDKRIKDLGITETDVRKHTKISYSTLKGLLSGTQKLVDLTNLIKMSSFLQLPKERTILLYINSLEQNKHVETSNSEKIKFIKENFDLVILKKEGFIDTVTDFNHIEEKIVEAFDLKNIFDYKKPVGDVAFSAGVIKPKNDLARSTWIKRAIDSFEAIDNPHKFDKEALINFFSEIRWHSTNIQLGMISVIKTLYKYGVTVLYQPPFSNLHLRGATLNVNNKRCIVLTDYKGFYPTIWFALLHELHHVIFDWEDIKYNRYHITDEDEELMSVLDREEAANNFAREYLLPGEKLKKIKPHLNNNSYIEDFAKTNHIHPSMVYVFHAKDVGNKDRMAWARANRYNPTIEFNQLTNAIGNSWKSGVSTKKYVKLIKDKLYL